MPTFGQKRQRLSCVKWLTVAGSLLPNRERADTSHPSTFSTDGAAGRALAKVIAFLAVTPKSASQAEQEKAFASADHILRGGRLGPTEIKNTLAHHGMALEPGDVLMIHDPACIAIETGSVIGLFVNVLQRGVTIKFVNPPFEITPSNPPSTAEQLLSSLDQHRRFLHGMKTHGGVKGKIGRPPSLAPEDREKVQLLVSDPNNTMAGIARDLGVSRGALYDYLEREGISRSR